MVGPVQGGGSQPPINGPSGPGSGTGTGSDAPLIADTLTNLGVGNTGLIILTAGNPQILKPSLFSVMQTVSLASVANKSNSYSISETINSVQNFIGI